MSFCHVWSWQPPQTASHIHIRHVQSVWTHWYAVHWFTVSPLHSYTHPTFLRFGVLGQLLSQMMWLFHDWGWQPTQTASHIHIRHMQSVWAHWYAVHMHMVAALHSYTHPTSLRFWGSVGCWVKMMWLCHGWGWQPPQTASHIHIRHKKVFEHIDMLSMGTQ